VPVVEQGRRGVLVGHEAGEAALAAAVVGLLGGLLDLVPHLHLGPGAQLRVVVAHREVGVLADRAEVHDGELGERVGGEGLAEARVQGPQRLVEEAVEHPALHRHALGQVLSADVLAEAHHAEVLGVVGHGAPVQRLVDAGCAARAAAGGLGRRVVAAGAPPGLQARRLGNADRRLALGEAVGAAGIVAARVVDEADAGVEGQAGVQVRGAEESVALRVVVAAPGPVLGDLERRPHRRVRRLCAVGEAQRGEDQGAGCCQTRDKAHSLR
jgi:hypothetical protein